MKKFFKVLGWILVILIVIIAAVASYVKLFLPNVGDSPEITVKVTPERIERGRYLANSVLVCMDCHSTRDFSKFAGPPVVGSLGKGGEEFNRTMGFPGDFYARNITPTNLADWSDGDIYRVITTGVSRDGHAIFPVMPYKYYASLDPEDVKDVIAYLRSLTPIENVVKPSKADFPFNFIMNTIPQKATPQTKPAVTDQVAYGKYLALSAGCFECHTKPDDKGQKVPGMDWAGGWEMGLGNQTVVRTANITPDPETGIGSWNEAQFVGRFKAFSDSSYVPHNVGPKEFQTIMPWVMYANMKEEDLKAIFAFLKTVKPVKHKVEKFSVVEPVAQK